MVKPSVAPPVIRRWVEGRLGPVARFHQLTEGEESQAFAFTHCGGDYVVRVRSELGGFAKERFAAERFGGPGLPIPEVITLGWLEGGQAACVTRRLPGTTLQGCGADALHRVARPVASVLETIAAADLHGTTGFGDFDEWGRGRWSRWRDFVAAPLGYAWAAAPHPVDAAALRVLLAALTRSAGGCPEERRLVHGDFGSNNVLTDGASVTGVLDWAEALFGDPLYDIANVLFWAPWLECMRIQADHFEAVLPAGAEVWERLRCYQVRIGLREMLHHAMHGPGAHLAWLTDRTMACARAPRGDGV